MEELKLILETIQAAGQGAMLLGILYFAKDVIITGLIISGILAIGKWTIHAVEQNSFLVTVAARFGMRTPLTYREKKELIERLDILMNDRGKKDAS